MASYPGSPANYSTNVSRLGQVNASGDASALFLTQFSGEVLTEFEQANKLKERTFVRSIMHGQTAQFPMIGLATSEYHTPGEWLDSQNIDQAQILISIDGLLVSTVFVANIDELENHYDVRGPYATELGRELARVYDRNIARNFVLAARGSSPLTGRAGGSAITASDMNTNADTIVAAMFTAAQTLDDKFVPEADRFSVFKPAQYYLLTQQPKVLYKDYGGNANIAEGSIKSVAGFDIVKSIHLPTVDDTSNTAIPSAYRADYSKNVGFAGTKWAVGTLQLADISMESDYETRRQGTFMLAKMAVGHKPLRSDCAVEFATT